MPKNKNESEGSALELIRLRREIEVNKSLDKVRAASMAMHHSDELSNVLSVMLNEFEYFNNSDEFRDIEIFIIDEATGDAIAWTSGQNFQNALTSYPFSFHVTPGTKKEYLTWKKIPINKRSELVINSFYKGKSWEKVLLDFEKAHELREIAAKFREEGVKEWATHHAYFSHGSIAFQQQTQLAPNDIEILQRFAKVFEQSYTRFLDLQKAEEQAREAQLEAALEKVRSAGMAMHSSDDLLTASKVLFSQLEATGLNAISCSITLVNLDEDSMELWVTHENEFSIQKVKAADHPNFREEVEAWKSGIKELKLSNPKEDFIIAVKEIFDFNVVDRKDRKDIHLLHVRHQFGWITLGTWDEPNQDKVEVCRRFAKVFEQTYTRFLDLQKAEAQAREAQIEAALERVRAASMAMHETDDLKNVVEVLFEQFKELDDQIIMAFVGIYHLEEKYIDQWFSPMEGITDEASSLRLPTAPWEETSIKEWKAGKEITHYSVLGKEAVIQYAREVDAMTGFKGFEKFARERGGENFESTEFNHKYGTLSIVQNRKPTVEEIELVKRFGKSFEQCYVRFKDLQKAEAQAREAQIEAALERVRARAMAMHDTQDLSDVLNVMFDQLQALDFGNYQVMFGILKEEEKLIEYWTKALPGFEFPQMFRVELIDHPFLNTTLQDHKDGQKQRYIVLEGNDKVTWDNHIFKSPDLQNMPEEAKKAMRSLPSINVLQAYLSHGMLLAIGPEPINPDNEDILKRFASAIDLTYTRFLDLQKAEAQAREAQIEVALERVRARAMAMHNSDELAEAAELLYSEFYQLGVTPFSCGYVINDDDHGRWKVWMTDSGDENFKDFWTLPFDADHHLISRYESWKNKELFHQTVLRGEENKIHHERIAEFAPWKSESLSHLPEQLVLSSAHFDLGHLLIVTPEVLSKEYKNSLVRFAKVFEQTYTRFLDLQKAENQARAIREERDRLDATLSELQSTQAQLIQSEKMASLGELTAGIAHEIQNPLNFVNNFSEVSTELLEELKEEIEGDNKSDALEVIGFLNQNLEKINHHGKRADSIVKGMLQHSRANTGEKVPTDINALCDEYVRLAYHGLRAKNQSFNADYDLNLNNSLGKINVVAQDISRVILNIITNAFQACIEKSQTSTDSTYAPKVTCATRSDEDQLTITISDNGPGIPQDIIDKIFQPFFTTKPTGQGTGLGLSMAYDIIKAHGGELRVESKVRVGTEFIIKLPL